MKSGIFQNRSVFVSKSSLQGGFIAGPILVGIALIIAIVAFMAFANRGPATSTSTQQNKINSSLLLKQGADLSEGYARAIGDGLTPAQVTFDTTTGTGLFDPTKGYAVEQTVTTKMCAGTTAPDCLWKLNKSLTVTTVGTTAADTVIAVNNLTVGTCEAINATLYNEVGDGAGANVPTSAVTGASIVAGTAGDMGLTAGAGRTDGCVKNGTSYTFYKVVNPV